MKKVLTVILACLTLTGVTAPVCASDTATATPSSASVKVNGADVSFSSFNIDGYNYFRLRDIARAADFNVSFEPRTATVLIDSKSEYLGDTEKPANETKGPVITSPVPLKIKTPETEHTAISYNIGDFNYLKLREIAQLTNFSVEYDLQAKTIHIDTDTAYSPEPETKHTENVDGITRSGTFAATNADGSINVPQGDGKFVPNAGDVIRCDDGTNYTITDMSRYDRSMFAKGPLGPLPEYDASAFTKADLPEIEVRHFTGEYDGHRLDNMRIFNAYESRRVEYTMYNLIRKSSETWVNGSIVKSKYGDPLVTVRIGMTEDDLKSFSCWPYNEDELVKYFNACPLGHYKIEVWDYYGNGIYQHTEYFISVR